MKDKDSMDNLSKAKLDFKKSVFLLCQAEVVISLVCTLFQRQRKFVHSRRWSLEGKEISLEWLSLDSSYKPSCNFFLFLEVFDIAGVTGKSYPPSNHTPPPV